MTGVFVVNLNLTKLPDLAAWSRRQVGKVNTGAAIFAVGFAVVGVALIHPARQSAAALEPTLPKPPIAGVVPIGALPPLGAGEVLRDDVCQEIARRLRLAERAGALKPVPDPAGKDLEHFYLQMDGAAVFKHAVVGFAEEIEKTLARENLKPEEIAWIVPHQANERILKAVSRRVGIPYDKFVVTIGKYGNTSAASVSMALGWAAEEGIFNDGDRIIFCSVGAGLTFAGGLLVW